MLGATCIAGPTYGQSNQCGINECFLERQIRDFEVFDRGTIVVYVGRDRCPYKIEVDQLYCNLTYLPEVEFVDRREKRIETVLRGGPQTDDSLLDEITDDITVGTDRGTANRRVCTYSPSLALKTQGFAAEAEGGLPPGDLPCRVRTITAMTDDELLELYVDQDLLPPPPPIGIGDISRTDDSDESAEAPDAEDER
jgi:hypothetical protein